MGGGGFKVSPLNVVKFLSFLSLGPVGKEPGLSRKEMVLAFGGPLGFPEAPGENVLAWLDLGIDSRTLC